MEEFLETIGGLEDLGNVTVQFADHFVDGLLPGWVGVLPGYNGVEELPERHLGHLQESIGNLAESVGVCVNTQAMSHLLDAE